MVLSTHKSHRTATRLTTVLLTAVLIPACSGLAQFGQNVELVHLTAMGNHNRWDVSDGVLLIGDNHVIERFVPGENGGFASTGMYLDEEDAPIVSLACHADFALAGYEDGYAVFDFDRDAPRRTNRVRDSHAYYPIHIVGDLAAVHCLERPDEEGEQGDPQLRLLDLTDPENIEVHSIIEERFEEFRLSEDRLVVRVDDDTFLIYDIEDPTEPRLASRIEPEERVWKWTLAGHVLAFGNLWDQDGIQLFDIADPDNPEAGANLNAPEEGEDDVSTYLLNGSGNRLAFFQIMDDPRFSLWVYDVEDVQNPELLRMMEIANIMSGGNYKFDEEDIYNGSGSFTRIVPNGEDGLAIANRHHPLVNADDIFLMNDFLYFVNSARVLPAQPDVLERPTFRFESAWAEIGIWDRIIGATHGEDWIALLKFNGAMHMVYIYSQDDDAPLNRQNVILDATEMFTLDNLLIIGNGDDDWQICDPNNLDGEFIIGEVDQPFAPNGQFRNGRYFCD